MAEPTPNPTPAPNPAPEPTPAPDYQAEVLRLQEELRKQTEKTSQLTEENEKQKKELRAKLTEQERLEAERKEKEEAREARIAELEKREATTRLSKRLISFFGDEKKADEAADALYGAENTDALIDAITKAWQEKEKALRLEFGKIPSPAAGGKEPPANGGDPKVHGSGRAAKIAAAYYESKYGKENV